MVIRKFYRRGFILLVALAVATSETVRHEDVVVGGYICGEFQNARVYYPTAPVGKIPLITFAHGFRCPGPTAYKYYSDMHTSIAASGYFLIVSESSAFPFECGDEWKDQMRSLEWARTSNFSRIIDLTKTGILGHSMGGGATYHLASIASAVQNLNISVAVALHPQIRWPLPIQPTTNSLVPISFGTGSSDSVVYASSVKAAYSRTIGVPKAFWEISGAGHDEPMNAPWGKHRHTPYVIAMFDCHLKGYKDQCSKIYGSGRGTLCDSEVNMTDCEHANEVAFEAVLV